jgi:hypothetical protein
VTPSLLRRVHERLAENGIAHALIGAAALAIHGISRSTFDQDLLVTDRRALEPTTWDGLAGMADVDIRRGDDDDPLAGVVRLVSPGERDVDVVVGRHEWQRRILDDAVFRDTPAGSLPVAAPEGLVLLKLYAGAPQDLWDIEQLRAVVGGPALDAAVNRQVESLSPRAREAWTRLTATS